MYLFTGCQVNIYNFYLKRYKLKLIKYIYIKKIKKLWQNKTTKNNVKKYKNKI